MKSLQADNGHLLISVSDTGAGLAPQQADQIFNAFFTAKPDGTGMGLPISRSIIESDTPREAGGLVSGAASKAVAQVARL
jgi:C4-dicarboxylate-specific signal transduction histidine kinase